MRNFLLSILLTVFAFVAFDQGVAAFDGVDDLQITVLDVQHMSAITASIDDSRDIIQTEFTTFDALEVVRFVYSTKPVGGLDHNRKALIVNMFRTPVGEYITRYRS